MSSTRMFYKSLPELRVIEINENNDHQTKYLNNTKSENNTCVHSHLNINEELGIDHGLVDVKRSKSMIFNTKFQNYVKMPIIYDEKTLEIDVMSVEKSKKINKIIFNNRSEDESDSGLCSEDSTDHCFNKSKYEFKNMKSKERLRRRQTSKINRLKSVSSQTKEFTRHLSLKSDNETSSNKGNDQAPQVFINGILECPYTKIKISEKENYLAPNDSNVSDPITNKTLKNSLESILHRSSKLNLSFDTTSALANAAALASDSVIKTNNDEETLQKIIDIVMPPLLISSNFDMTASNDVAELSIIMQQHLNEAVTNKDIDFTGLNRNTATNNNETNEHIMRACLNYLEYLNKKHTRERELQAIRNKVSGLVLLAIVFIVIFGLGSVMCIYLVNSLARIIYDNINESKLFALNDSTTSSL